MSASGTAVRYVPGHAVLLQHGQRAVILRLLADHGLVGETWSRLEQGASIDQLLEIILGEGLRTVSEFALLERSSGSLRMILRGGIGAEVRRDTGTEAIETEGIWVDRRLEGEGVLALTTDGGDTSGQQLPLEGGIVLAGGVLVPLTEGSRHHEGDGIGAPVRATGAAAEPLVDRSSPAAPAPAPVAPAVVPVPAPAGLAEDPARIPAGLAEDPARVPSEMPHDEHRELAPESLEQGDPVAQPEFVDTPVHDDAPFEGEGPVAAYGQDEQEITDTPAGAVEEPVASPVRIDPSKIDLCQL